MGDITIKIPQKISRAFKIDSRKGAEEVLSDLERRSRTNGSTKTVGEKKFDDLRKLIDGYRSDPDERTNKALEIADSLRKGWNR